MAGQSLRACLRFNVDAGLRKNLLFVAVVAMNFAPPLINRAWTGNLAISGRPQVDMARYAVVLADPRVEGMNINGLDPAYASQVTRIGSFLAEQLLMDMPLYTFRPEDLRFAGTSFNPTAIAMRQDAVVITFEPVK